MSNSSGRSSSVYSNINEVRNNKIKKYWLKKQHRVNQKQVRYGCRQNLARQRFRHQGRFITKKEMEQLDPDQIYDPNLQQVPRVKQIFKISKEHNRSLSCLSSHSGSSKVTKPLLLGGEPSSDMKNDLTSQYQETATISGILPLSQMRLFNSQTMTQKYAEFSDGQLQSLVKNTQIDIGETPLKA